MTDAGRLPLACCPDAPADSRSACVGRSGDAAGLAVSAPPTVSVSAALSRLRQEATFGSCDTGRYRCPFFVWGRGPPIVLIPGITDNSQSFALVMSHLISEFTCVGYDLPNGAADGAKLGRYRHDDLVRDLIALNDHLGVRPCYVVACSYGASVALRLMHVAPDRVARAVLIGAFARRPIAWVERALCRFARFWPGRMRSMPLPSSLNNPDEKAVFRAAAPDRFAFMRENCGAAPIAAVARHALLLDKLDLRPILPGIVRPVLLIRGDRDRIVPRQYDQELLNGLPLADRVEIPDAGHVPQYTHAELVAELTRQFLTPPISA